MATTYGQYDPKWNKQQVRNQDTAWYNDAVNRLQNKGFEKGSDLYNKNAQRVYDLGKKWGFDWQKQLGKDYTPPGQQPPAAGSPPAPGSIPAPQGLRPENLPMYNMLSDDERRKFFRIRQQDPRAALRFMQQTTKGRQAQGQQQPPPPPPPADQGQTTPPPPPSTDQSQTPPANQQPGSEFDVNYQSPMSKALMEAFNNVNNTLSAYEPKFFEGSPMYQFQKQKGMADLEKLMAARGLTGSGAEIQGNSDFLANINATEAEKQRQYAEAERDRRQRGMEFIANFNRSEREDLRDQWNRNLDRQQNISEFEATRGDRRQEAAINFLNNILGMQAQNDIARISVGGQNSQTDLTKALMQMIGNNIMSQVPRATGGGGGGAPPPAPSNMTGLYEIMARYGNQAGNNDMLNSILRIFG